MTSSMARYACWKQQEVARTIVDDANRDAPAVFSAVHRPSRILSKSIRRSGTDPGVPVREVDVLDALLGGDAREDRIVPIVGESGTGKSHLIRWLNAHIPRQSDRHVVYIEKRGTSLRQVIHEILKGLDGPEVRHRDRFIELREEVDKAAAGLDPDAAPLRLLIEMAQAIREHGVDNATGESDRQDREDLAAGLPDLLLDPEFRQPLLAEGGVIAATVNKALGRAASDGEAPAFTELRLEIGDVMRAGATAREMRQDLYGDPDLLELAIRMLNEQLNPALGALIGVDRTQVYQVMLNVREALLDEGKTLVLLVEDFALLRGVETQLLDAMIADQQSQGEDVLCPMRSALAVTSGYFEGKDTALTRIHSRGKYVYSLDAELGESDTAVAADDVHAFVATYLNAARVGRAELESRFDARRQDAEDEREWIPNACASCDFERKCHPAFGTGDGYGLYPFNAAALDRIVGSQMEKFDPRHILQILDDTLGNQRKALTEGEFPDPKWAEQYNRQQVPGQADLPNLPVSVATTYEERDPGTADRRKTLATFWGEVPQQAVDLDPTIHEAFDLPPLGLPRPDDPVVPPDRPKPPGEVEPPKPPVVDSAHDRDNRALDAWARQQVLEQELANRVRRALATAVRGAREWSCYGVDQKQLERAVANQTFSLGGHAKGEGSSATAPIGKVEPTDRNAFMLQGVLQAERQGDWTFDRGLERFVAFSTLVDAWAEEAFARLRPPEPSASGTDTQVIAQLLVIGSVVLGHAGPGQLDGEVLEAMFSAPPVSADGHWGLFMRRLVDGPSGAASRSELVEMLQTTCRLRRAPDAAAVIAIDAGPLLAAIADLRAKEWRIPTPDETAGAERPVRQYADSLRKDLAHEILRHLADLAVRRSSALALLGDAREPAKVVKVVMQGYGAAYGVVGTSVRGVDRAELEAQFRRADLTGLDRLDGLERIDDMAWPELLDLLFATSGEALRPINDYLSWADAVLDAGLREVDAALGGGGEDNGDGVVSTTAELVNLLRDLAKQLEGTTS